MSLRSSLSREDEAILFGSEVFQSLTRPQFTEVTKVMRVKEFGPGKVIMEEGQVGRGLSLVLTGTVEVFLPKTNPDGDERPGEISLAKIGPGSCFGEFSLLDEKPVSASVRAVGEVRTGFLSAYDFEQISDDDDAIGKLVFRNLLSLLVGRLRHMDEGLDIAFLVK